MGADGVIDIGRGAAKVAEGPRVSAWERFSFEAARVFLRFTARVMPLELLYQLGRLFAILEWTIQYKRRRRFAKRMQECFGSEISGARLRDASLRHFIRMRTDKMYYLLMDHLPRSELAKRFTMVNRELIDEPLAAGRGVYMAMSHVGSHHIALIHLVEMGYSVGGVRDPKEGASRRYIQIKHSQKRERVVQYFHNDVFPRELFKWLKGANILASLMDPARLRDEHLKTVEVTMFGRSTQVLRGPLDLANRCGVPTIQAFLVSRPGFRYEFRLLGPLIDPAQIEDPEQATQQTLQTYADRIEEFIRTYPCHVSRI